MVSLPLGTGTYKRTTAGEPEIALLNRYFEQNPTNRKEQASLLARTGTTKLSDFEGGLIRGNFSKAGLFNGDLFVTSGENLYRYATDGTKTLITGVVNGSGTPSIAWQKGIGYERLFIADGLLLQYYEGGSRATGTLRYSTYDYSWDSQTSANDNNWTSVCWSSDLTLFCAVASSASDGGQVMTSPDGVTWTERTAAASAGWRSVCWSSELGLFVAVGVGGVIMTSTDGTTWTSRTSPVAADFNGVCWSPDLGLFVAVASVTGVLNQVITSPDGVNWTDRVAAAANDWQAVCWASDLELFVAVANTGIGDRVMTSPDGINWETQVSASDVLWRDVCWAPDAPTPQFCAVAERYVMTSPDGVAWTAYALPALLEGRGVTWSSQLGLFVAVGNNNVMTSPDGVTWTERTPAANHDWQSVCFSDDLLMLCAVASTGSGDRVMTSQETSAVEITDQVIEIGGVYYSWNADVDNNSPDGTSSHPWLALLGDTSSDSLANMVKLLMFNGERGTDFSTALGGPNTLVTAESDKLLMTLTAISDGADGNSITTSVFSGSGLTWSDTTLTGGGTHTLHGVTTPDGVGIDALSSNSGYVLCSVANSQKFFWVMPGETTIDPLNFAEKESNPDVIVDMLTVGDQTYIMGNGSIEVWYPTGDINAPFEPQEGRVPQRGVVAGTAVLVTNDVVLFVGNDGKVYSLSGDGLSRVSNNGIEERIRKQLRREQGLTP